MEIEKSILSMNKEECCDWHNSEANLHFDSSVFISLFLMMVIILGEYYSVSYVSMMGLGLLGIYFGVSLLLHLLIDSISQHVLIKIAHANVIRNKVVYVGWGSLWNINNSIYFIIALSCLFFGLGDNLWESNFKTPHPFKVEFFVVLMIIISYIIVDVYKSVVHQSLVMSYIEGLVKKKLEKEISSNGVTDLLK